ncbi:MAG TPA: hypothetical protein VMZ53_10075 [Kofleriaceae bacterium]|nr:hypothetical protein [Kofleriaceae bacterium]
MPQEAGAWSIGSQLNYEGCHERITATAFRNARALYMTAPRIVPNREEAGLIGEVQFVPPSDFVDDLAPIALLLGVRDSDLKGHNPLNTLSLVGVHGDPITQEEHCIRAETDDGDAGNESALAACRRFIVRRATEALDGLTASGEVDPNIRVPLPVYVSFTGHVKPELPLFYIRMGQAVHAVEDGFTHTYRTSDGALVTVVMNWIDNTSGTAATELTDGPVHLAPMDHCESPDPLVARNQQLAIEASTAFLAASLDPAMTREQKIATFETLAIKYFSYQPGCTFDNNYCDAPEPSVAAVGCDAGRQGRSWSTALFVIAAVLLARRRRNHIVGVAAITLTLAALPAHADTTAPTAPTAPTDPATATPPAAASEPAVPITSTEPGDAASVREGTEPGRDASSLTVGELSEVREDKRLGSRIGVSAMLGGSIVHAAADISIGARYRLNENWLIGLDAEWNPWFTAVPITMKRGVASVYATLVRRFPMAYNRVNLRTSVHVGVSTLLFDVNGAPMYSMGPFVSFTPLGIDYDLGGAVRLVLDPVEIAVPAPNLGLIPLYYEQFRLMIGLQIGA